MRMGGLCLGLLLASMLGTISSVASEETSPSGPVHFYVANTAEGDNTVSVIDHASRSVVATIDVGGQPHGSAPSHAGDFVYVTVEGTAEIAAIVARSHEVVWRVSVPKEMVDNAKLKDSLSQFSAMLGTDTRLHEPSISADDRFVFAPDLMGGRVFVLDTVERTVGQIAMIDPKDGSLLSTLHNSFASADGKWVYQTSIFSKKLARIDVRSQEVARVYELRGQPRPAALLADGSKIYVQYSMLHGFAEVDLESGAETGRVEWPETKDNPDPSTKCHGIGVRPDQKQIWAASNVEGKVFVHSLPDLKPIGSVEVGVLPNWIAFTPDGRYAYVTTQEPDQPRGRANVIDTETLEVVARIELGGRPKRIHAVRVSKN